MTMTQDDHDKIKDHGTIIVDADHHFTIDVETRSITNSENKKTSLIQFDHNSERFSFDIKREIEGHDILLCNRVQIHYIIATGQSRTTHKGLYPVTDLAVHPDDNTKACFSWLISEDATHYDGRLSFLVSFECVKEDSNPDDDDATLYRWNSGICSTIVVVPGMNNSGAIVQNYPDVLLQWENYLTTNFEDLESALVNTTIPNMVDQRYIEREFATSAEVAAIFGIDESGAGDST